MGCTPGIFACFGAGQQALSKLPKFADDEDMSVLPAPGTPVVVVLRSAEPVQWQGHVVAVRDASIAVRLSGPRPEFDPLLPYVIISGEPGSRFSAPARLTAQNGAAAAFKLTSGWKPLDLRKAPRFATDLKAEVRSVLGNSRQPGRVIDISTGGAAVAVDSRPGGSQIELGISANGYSARLVCDVLNTSEVGSDTVLHVKFASVSPPHQAFLRQLVASLMEAEAKRAS